MYTNEMRIAEIKKLRKLRVKVSKVSGDQLNYIEASEIAKVLMQRLHELEKEITANPYSAPIDLNIPETDKPKAGAEIAWVNLVNAIGIGDDYWARIMYKSGRFVELPFEELPYRVIWFINNADTVRPMWDKTFVELQWLYKMGGDK